MNDTEKERKLREKIEEKKRGYKLTPLLSDVIEGILESWETNQYERGNRVDGDKTKSVAIFSATSNHINDEVIESLSNNFCKIQIGDKPKIELLHNKEENTLQLVITARNSIDLAGEIVDIQDKTKEFKGKISFDSLVNRLKEEKVEQLKKYQNETKEVSQTERK